MNKKSKHERLCVFRKINTNSMQAIDECLFKNNSAIFSTSKSLNEAVFKSVENILLEWCEFELQPFKSVKC